MLYTDGWGGTRTGGEEEEVEHGYETGGGGGGEALVWQDAGEKAEDGDGMKGGTAD